MTPKQIEAMKLALEALGVVTKEMLTIRDELAEYGAGRPITNGIHQLLWDSSFKAYTETAIPAYAALKKALAEHAMRETQRLGQEIEQEPVAWMDEFGNVFPLGAQRGPKYLNEPMKPLYTTPPQRTWVGLTDEDIWEAYMESPVELDCSTDELYALSRTVEAKLKEKNQ
jgi:hypothetical protein